MYPGLVSSLDAPGAVPGEDDEGGADWLDMDAIEKMMDNSRGSQSQPPADLHQIFLSP